MAHIRAMYEPRARNYADVRFLHHLAQQIFYLNSNFADEVRFLHNLALKIFHLNSNLITLGFYITYISNFPFKYEF